MCIRDRYDGKLAGNASNYILNYKAQNNLLPALYWLKKEYRDVAAFVMDTNAVVEGVKDTFARGSVLLKGLTQEQARSMASRFGLDLQATKTSSVSKQHKVDLPRVAIYHTWYY